MDPMPSQSTMSKHLMYHPDDTTQNDRTRYCMVGGSTAKIRLNSK